jgi:putative GTP pyrophosphokinase
MPPSHSKSEVDRARRALADDLEAAQKNPGLIDDEAFLERLVAAIDVVDWWRGEHAKPLSRVAANLRYYVAKEGDPVVGQRLKRVPAIAGKLLRESNMKLSRMADIGGVRAILPDQAAAYRVASHLRRNWTITKVRDYVINPKEDGYRALHPIGRNRGQLVEIQLRTPNQDMWANYVETFSRTAVPGLKFGLGPAVLREFLSDTAEMLAQEDLGLVSSEEAVDFLKERAIEMVNLVLPTNES